MVELYYDKPAMNKIISHMDGVVGAVSEEADSIGSIATAILDEAKASTRWRKIHPELSPPGLTKIEVEHGIEPHTQDSHVILEALNPMALEFGHSPSGVFGPGGSLGHLKTKSPEGLYILHKASGFGLE